MTIHGCRSCFFCKKKKFFSILQRQEPEILGGKNLRKRKHKQEGGIAFLDTEFNATDYPEQNNGHQEITQIGVVVFRRGKIEKTFLKYCKISETSQLSKRSQEITGITPDILDKFGIPFMQAMEELNIFLADCQKIYAFGSADAIELRDTTKLNNGDIKTYSLINKIKDIRPIFAARLGLHFTYSLTDICKICQVDHEGRAHSALNDAEDTGFAYYHMKSGLVNQELIQQLETQKNKIRNLKKKQMIFER